MLNTVDDDYNNNDDGIDSDTGDNNNGDEYNDGDDNDDDEQNDTGISFLVIYVGLTL